MSEKVFERLEVVDQEGVKSFHDGTQELIAVQNGSGETIPLAGSNAIVVVGGKGHSGVLQVRDAEDTTTISLDGQGGSENGGGIRVRNQTGDETVFLDGDHCNLLLGAANGTAPNGAVYIRNAAGKTAIRIEGDNHNIHLTDDNARDSVRLNGRTASIAAGAAGVNGTLVLRNEQNQPSIQLDARRGNASFHGQTISHHMNVQARAIPGTVMIVQANGVLAPCSAAGQSGVIGVVAPELQQGITFGVPGTNRQRIATGGIVLCNVDATSASIPAGALLMASSTPGYAQVWNGVPGRAFGKALQEVEDGKAAISVLLCGV